MTNPQTPNIPPAAAPHAPPADDEAIYYQGSPLFGGQPEKVVLLALCGSIFLIGPVLVRVFAKQWPPGWVWAAMAIVGIIFWIIPFLITKSIRYRISNYRIDFERGLIARNINTLELWHVEDLSFHQSILDRIIGIGSIRILSHDDNMPNLYMRGLPNARKIFEELKQRIIAVKRQTGVLKVDTGN